MKPSLHSAIAAVLTAATLGAASSASAQLHAQSSFDNFSYQLVDLNPQDGSAPGVSFLGGSANAWALFRDDSGAVRDSAQANSSGGPIQVLIDTADGHLAGNANLTSGSSLVNIQDGVGDTNTDSFLGFVLAPYTQVTFSIDATAIASAASAPNYAFATAAVNGFITDENGNALFTGDGLSSYLASSDTLSVTLTSAAVALTGTLEFATAAHALVVEPVPEPASTAMFVAGLAVVGRRFRRRARGIVAGQE